MTEQGITITLIILALFLAAAWIIWRDKEKRRKWFLAKVRKMWGSVADREYTEPELDSISRYAHKHQGGRFMIDDITWNDLDMDKIFMVLNTTVSSCGEDVLYHMLRVPEFEWDTLQKRDHLVEYFRAHQKEREQIQQVVCEVRKFSSMSLSDYIYVLKDVERTGNVKYKLLALVNVIAIALLLINPLAGGILLFIGICVNGLVHMKDSKKIEPYLNCMICILRLLRAADGFEKIKNPEIQSYLDRIKKGRKNLQNFRRGAWLVASTNSVQDGLEAFVISYLKILFMVDMIKFYSMLKYVDGHEQEIEDMFAAMGELDALIAIASFREFLPYYCVPEFSCGLSEHCGQENISFHAEDMYHPLIPNPVANSISMNQGVLVTGSNASGKSTFLKTLALNAILAQTIYTCTCHNYQSVYLKVMTSMALRDNLEGGESYFIVEIKSLQRIMKECEKEQPVLCIVDEVLRGTNTIERIAASSQILRSLARPHVLPLAATHDIELSYILEDCYTNYHFEEEIREHDVIFNYLLKKGRATTRNAIRLLEIIGYDPAIIQDAQEMAKRFEETGVWKN